MKEKKEHPQRPRGAKCSSPSLPKPHLLGKHRPGARWQIPPLQGELSIRLSLPWHRWGHLSRGVAGGPAAPPAPCRGSSAPARPLSPALLFRQRCDNDSSADGFLPARVPGYASVFSTFPSERLLVLMQSPAPAGAGVTRARCRISRGQKRVPCPSPCGEMMAHPGCFCGMGRPVPPGGDPWSKGRGEEAPGAGGLEAFAQGQGEP